MSRLYLYANVLLEVGGLRRLPEEASRLSLARPLLVTDPGLSALGLAQRCKDMCPELCIYDRTPENPTEAAAREAVAMYRDLNCDGVVALGGGSSMDLGKAVCLLVSHPGTLADYDLTGPDPQPLQAVPPLLVIPTTSGTGTEVAMGCVISLDNGHKTIIDSDKLIPAAVICDPELTVSLPPRLTAATGIDALSHCIEGYCSNIDNPLTESVALDGVRRMAGALERAVREPDNLDARRDMMIGSLQGGLAMTMELGAAHAVSVPLGEHVHGHHGELTGAMLGAAMEFNEPVEKARMAQIRDALNIPTAANLREWMNEWCEALGLRVRLSELGVTQDSLEILAAEASSSFFNATNPRKGSAEEYLRMLEAQL